MATEESLGFDRAASFYDRTRSLDPELMARITSMLVAELAGRGRALEIGVGTGRIALPLHAAGIPLAGIDLSAPMLGRLVQNAGGATPFPVAIADATRLPFGSDAFVAGLVCHVLHLVPGWRAAVAELVRVVRPGGTVLVDIGGWPRNDAYHGISQRFLAEAGLPDRRRGVQDWDEMDAAMAAHGAAPRRLGVFELAETKTYAEIVDDYERGTYSITWDASEEDRSRAARKVREWLTGEVSDLNHSFEINDEIVWTAYDLPPAEL